jgi:predicted lipid-binding transport protein (Tim44 family)
MKRLLLVMMTFTFFFTAVSISVPAHTSAATVQFVKSYKSPKGTFKQPATNPNSGVSKTQPTTGVKDPATAGTTTAPKRGFTAGGFARGLFIGGLAGMLFGGMFGNMGFFGNILGLLVNVMAVVFLFMIIRRIFAYFTKNRRYDNKRY